MNQPSLSTPRLELRPADSRDIDRLHALWSQPQVRRFLFDDPDVPLRLAQAILDSCLACSASGYGLWLVHHKESRELLGCVGLMPATTAAEHEPALAGTLEILAALDAAQWHKGYAREAGETRQSGEAATAGREALGMPESTRTAAGVHTGSRLPA